MPDDVQNDEVDTNQHETSFFATLLTPGSSLHPTFLLILDVAFAFLLGIFLALVWLTSGSIHIFVLIGIELCLWASVKWCVIIFRSLGWYTESSPGSSKSWLLCKSRSKKPLIQNFRARLQRRKKYNEVLHLVISYERVLLGVFISFGFCYRRVLSLLSYHCFVRLALAWANANTMHLC